MNYGLFDFTSETFIDSDWLAIILITIATVVLFVAINLWKYFVHGEREFNPFKKKSVTDLSRDKRLAQYHYVPDDYLSKEPDGFTVGKYKRRYVRLPFQNSPEHQLILGSPGSNKSTSILSALIYNFNFASDKEKLGAVLALDVKPELQKKSSLYSDPKIRMVNPSSFGENNYGFDLWYGLSSRSSDDQIKERMEMIARSIIPNLSGDNVHFSANAQKLLSGFLMYGFIKGLSFSDSVIKIMHVSTEDLIAEIITDPIIKQHPKVLDKVKGFNGNDSDEFASIKDTMEKDLDIFNTETVKWCFSGNPRKATPEDLLNGISIFLAIPDHLIVSYKTVFGVIMEICLKYLTSIPEEELEDKKPVWCLIDEGGTIYVPSLLDVASRGRSKKIQLSIVAQSFSQLEDLYGDRNARAIMDCCKTTIVFSCNDTKTAENLSKRTGYYRETKTSYQSKGLLTGDSSTTTSMEYRPVMDVSDINMLERNKEVLVFTIAGWFLVKKAPYFTIPMLLEKSDEIVAANKAAGKVK
ncbi:MAG: type IV secretory system conjugative DNA transfer family protein [Erysipelotrichaceae bacterium]|nr:type IV secretory system conjugative DNA transfer family protein [Erysipelotrichaceae bacterium]MBQ6493164.1 type IV secretory system conjugative DNA transfer family protein [Erysipelotrichaceae bacterium]